MPSKSKKDLAFGVIVLAIGLAYLFMTMRLPSREGIDSATVPWILALVITALGLIQIAAVAMRPREEPATAAAAPDCGCAPAPARPDYRTVFVTAVLITLYVVFLDALGFPLMSILYLFAQFVVLTPNHVRKNYPLYAFIAVVTSLFVYYLFLYAFEMMLPDGNFWWDIGLFR